MIPGYISVFRAQETKTYFELRNYEAARKMGGGEEVADQNVTYIEKKNRANLLANPITIRHARRWPRSFTSYDTVLFQREIYIIDIPLGCHRPRYPRGLFHRLPLHALRSPGEFQSTSGQERRA